MPWDFNNQILSNPMESDGIHEILIIKSNYIQNFYNSKIIYLGRLQKKTYKIYIYFMGGTIN